MSASEDDPEASRSPRVRIKIWVEDDAGVLLSEWRADLLEAVDSTGSIARAAEQLGVPYRTAWQRIHEIEEALGFPLLQSESGGREGGGSHLTPRGRSLVTRFRAITDGLEQVVEQRFAEGLRDELG